MKPGAPSSKLLRQNQELKAMLQEAEDALRAIREGEVDAIVVSGSRGRQIFSLNTQDEAYRRIVQTMNEAAFTTTRGGKILYANAQLATLTGTSDRELVGRMLSELVTEESKGAVSALLRECESRPAKRRIIFCGPSGPVPVLVSAGPLEQTDGLAVCMVATDLTELEVSMTRLVEKTKELDSTIERLRTEAQTRARIQEELRAANLELKQSTNQLRNLAGELAIAEQRERRRLASTLHDSLQQLLVGAQLQLERVMRGGGDNAAEQARLLIRQSLEVSRSLTAELSPPVLHTSGLGATLQWLVQWIGQKQRLGVDLDLPARMPRMSEEVTIQIFQSVRELLFNVVKHAQVSQAAIRARVTPSELVIVVSDRGVGFDSLKLAQRTGTESFGLFSIRERLSLFGGVLGITSSPGKGSTFTLSIPLLSLEPAGRRAESAPPHAPPHATPACPRIRVLLVDDFALTRKGIAQLIQEAEDMEIVGEAADGRTAVEMAERFKPDVVVMDVNMPGMDGVEATRLIAQGNPSVAVVGLSMHDDDGTASAIRKAGARAYINKADSPRQLMDAIRSCRGTTAPGT